MRDRDMSEAETGYQKPSDRSTFGAAPQDKFNERQTARVTDEQPLLEEITQRIVNATARLVDIAARIEDQGNRLFGPQPLGVAGSDKEPTKVDPQGVVDFLFLALSNLDQTIARTNSAHARISRV